MGSRQIFPVYTLPRSTTRCARRPMQRPPQPRMSISAFSFSAPSRVGWRITVTAGPQNDTEAYRPLPAIHSARGHRRRASRRQGIMRIRLVPWRRGDGRDSSARTRARTWSTHRRPEIHPPMRTAQPPTRTSSHRFLHAAWGRSDLAARLIAYLPRASLNPPRPQIAVCCRWLHYVIRPPQGFSRIRRFPAVVSREQRMERHMGSSEPMRV